MQSVFAIKCMMHVSYIRLRIYKQKDKLFRWLKQRICFQIHLHFDFPNTSVRGAHAHRAIQSINTSLFAGGVSVISSPATSLSG
jgi:hypothetical protein